jgi:hypothetical protein
MIPHDLLRRLFDAFDTDADGRVSREEFRAGLSRGSCSSTTTAKVLQAADVAVSPAVLKRAQGEEQTNANGPAVSPAVSPQQTLQQTLQHANGPAVSPAVLKGAQGEEHRKIKVYVAKDETRTAFRIKRTAPVPHFTGFTS